MDAVDHDRLVQGVGAASTYEEVTILRLRKVWGGGDGAVWVCPRCAVLVAYYLIPEPVLKNQRPYSNEELLRLSFDEALWHGHPLEPTEDNLPVRALVVWFLEHCCKELVVPEVVEEG